MHKPSVQLPDNPEELARQGWKHLKEGRYSLAMKASEKLVRLAPEMEAAQYLMSKTALQVGNAKLALAHAQKALAISDNAALHLQLAQCLLVLGMRDGVRVAINKTVSRAPTDVAILVVAGSILNQIDDAVDAKEIFLKARKLEPDNPSVLFNLATSLRFLGELDEAEETIEHVILLAPDNPQSVLFRADLRRQTPEHNHIEDLEARIARGAKDWKGEMNLNYALAKEAEDIGDFEKSFKALEKGSGIRRRHLEYHVERDVAVLSDIRRHYAATETCAAGDGFGGDAPVFVVGMPRTGTTLVERMLASHSQVVSAGELHDFSSELVKEIMRNSRGKPVAKNDIVRASLDVDFAQLGRNYVTAARQAVGRESPHFIDKLPFNFLYCGLIHRALPNARIIHVMREPMDTCYAVFKTLFGQAYPFSYDLKELAAYYIAYRKLMDHWRGILPGLIFDVAYEDVVSDPERQCRRLLAHCELEWEPECLEFYHSKSASTTASAVQVRQPIYSTSIQKWRNYERQLEPLRSRLADAGYLENAKFAI
jgi:tetratricopeptide (TPR) repeat protein